MCGRDVSVSSTTRQSSPVNDDQKLFRFWPLWAFLVVLIFDVTASIILVKPNFSDHYTLYGSLTDLSLLAILRFITVTYALLRSYLSDQAPPESPFDLYNKNGDRKTSEELDQEALEEKWYPWLRRYTARPAFSCEIVTLITGILVVVKCLARLDVELGRFADSVPCHLIFWLTLSFVACIVVIESVFLDSVTIVTGEYGRFRRQRSTNPSFLQRIGSSLRLPLLPNDGLTSDEGLHDVEDGQDDEEENSPDDTKSRGTSDIAGDANYKAGLPDLFGMIYDDLHLIAFAFVFLIAAALAQIYIPRYTGKILDALAATFSHDGDDDGRDTNIIDVPGFMSNVRNLIVMAILGGIFSGIRGSIFTIIGGRVNVRLRTKLMDSLLSQDVGFFDTTKTGDITSRLSSDTTLVGDQVSLNVNVFLRSVVQAIGVLFFMFLISWQLSILAFVSVPAITVMSKWYGNYVRSLTKLMQKKLADGNSVSDAALGSMSTVRAFDAAHSELKEFEESMNQYLWLNKRSAIAYIGYCTCFTSLPQLVIAIVLFYGGLLVRNGDISSGQLVSFLLYLSSLSEAFSSIGYIFSSLTQAVGAADKVFELMHRKPRITSPSVDREYRTGPNPNSQGFVGIQSRLTDELRHRGIVPSSCIGEVTLNNVDLFYPARPQRRVLHGMTLKVPPGAVIALVGPSGSGKSSVMSLVQHLYEPSAGEVCIDGRSVHNLSPKWLSRNVSVVSQEPTLFARSVRRNIMYGLEGTEDEPSEEKIIEAATLANAHDFIEKLPFGYETDVGERGVQLSGGQKQRIAIARALVRRPRILLLDEATSALDAESEALVQEAIDHMLSRGRGRPTLDSTSINEASMTVLVVAHRLSTVRNADIIFVVEDGQVVEQGDHDELLSQNGAYTSLIRRQMNAKQKLESSNSEVDSVGESSLETK